MLKNPDRMKHALTEWAIKEGLFDDAHFYTQQEWSKREEQMHDGALMVLVIDGSGLWSLLNTGCDTLEFEDLVESFGFWYEQGYSWSLGFYPTDNYDYCRLSGTYASKLSDPRWKRKAALVKKEAAHQCQDCGAKGYLEAHHCYYTTTRARVMSHGNIRSAHFARCALPAIRYALFLKSGCVPFWRV